MNLILLYYTKNNSTSCKWLRKLKRPENNEKIKKPKESKKGFSIQHSPY